MLLIVAKFHSYLLGVEFFKDVGDQRFIIPNFSQYLLFKFSPRPLNIYIYPLDRLFAYLHLSHSLSLVSGKFSHPAFIIMYPKKLNKLFYYCTYKCIYMVALGANCACKQPPKIINMFRL